LGKGGNCGLCSLLELKTPGGGGKSSTAGLAVEAGNGAGKPLTLEVSDGGATGAVSTGCAAGAADGAGAGALASGAPGRTISFLSAVVALLGARLGPLNVAGCAPEVAGTINPVCVTPGVGRCQLVVLGSGDAAPPPKPESATVFGTVV